MTTMLEALANKYKTANLTTDELTTLQQNLTRATYLAPMGTTVPSKNQNRIRSGRASRRAARNRQVEAAVGGLSYSRRWDWTRSADTTRYPIGYPLCNASPVTTTVRHQP